MSDYIRKCAGTTTGGDTVQSVQSSLPLTGIEAVNLYLVPPFSITEADAKSVKRREFFAFLFRDKSSKIHQHMVTREEIPEYIKTLDSNNDCWLCPNSFYRLKRGNAFIARMGAIYVDLDFYKTKRFKDCTTTQVVQALFIYCHENDIPRPSYIKSSGRGLQILWLFERAIPAKAMGRWRAVEKHFCHLFDAFGSDPAATDPARMLRLEGTINKKNLCYCQPIHVEREKDGSVTRYNFEFLCEELPAKSRKESHQKRSKEDGQEAKKKRRKRTGPAWFAQVSNDIEKLIAMRKVTPEGLRMLTLFWHMNFLALSRRVSLDNFFNRARVEARKICSTWDYSDQELKTLYERYKKYKEQEFKLDQAGRRRLMLYTPSSETLIRQLGITVDELQHMPSLQHRGRQPRLSKTGVTMADRSQRSLDRLTHARELRREGMSIRDIAKMLKCSKSAVQRYVANYLITPSAEPPRPALGGVSHSLVSSMGVATPSGGTLCFSTISRASDRATTCPASPLRRTRSPAGTEWGALLEFVDDS